MILKNKTIDNGTKTPYLGMEKTMAVLSQTISYHNFLIIPNRYENPAQGIKTDHLGMK
jgi:hypothetical protein